MQGEQSLEPAMPEPKTYEGHIESAQEISPIEAQLLDASFVSNRNKQILDLLKPYDVTREGVLLTKNGIEYNQKGPTPIKNIAIRVTEPKTKIRAEVSDRKGKVTKVSLTPSPSDPCQLNGDIWTDATKIKIVPDTFIPFQKYKVLEVQLHGLLTEDLMRGLNDTKQLMELRDSVISLAKEHAGVLAKRELEIKNLRTIFDEYKKSAEVALKRLEQESAEKLKANSLQIEKQNSEIQKLQSQINALSTEKEDEEKSLQFVVDKKLEAETELKDVKLLVAQKNELKDELDSSLQSLRKDVQDWMSKKHLFTADLDGVLKENNSQSNIFLALSLIPLGLSAYLVWRLYDGATAMLNNILVTTPPENIWAYLATRAPYAVVSGLFIGSLMKYAFPFLISKVFELYSLRNRLQERCFLVKKITENVSNSLGLTDEQAAKVLVEEKMDYIEKTIASKSDSPFVLPAITKLDATDIAKE